MKAEACIFRGIIRKRFRPHETRYCTVHSRGGVNRLIPNQDRQPSPFGRRHGVPHQRKRKRSPRLGFDELQHQKAWPCNRPLGKSAGHDPAIVKPDRAIGSAGPNAQTRHRPITEPQGVQVDVTCNRPEDQREQKNGDDRGQRRNDDRRPCEDGPDQQENNHEARAANGNPCLQFQTLRKTSVLLVPPKPKAFDNAARIFIGRA